MLFKLHRHVCQFCGHTKMESFPASGFYICNSCHDETWSDEDEAGLEDYEDDKRRRIAEANEY